MFWPMIIGLPLPLMITVIFPLSAPKFDKLLESCILGTYIRRCHLIVIMCKLAFTCAYSGLMTGNTANRLYISIFIGAAIIVMALAYLAFAVKLQYGSRMTNGTRVGFPFLVIILYISPYFCSVEWHNVSATCDNDSIHIFPLCRCTCELFCQSWLVRNGRTAVRAADNRESSMTKLFTFITDILKFS